MNLRAYIAAPWELQDDAKRLAAVLLAAGMHTSASWLHATSETFGDEWAQRCLVDIRRADLLLAWNPEEWARTGTGGRHVEVGYAVALALPVIVVGARTNIFHYLRQVEHVAIDSQMLVNIMAIVTKRRLS